MAEQLRTLAQLDLAVADTEEELYLVPGDSQVVVSSLIVCNRTAVDRTFRVSIDVGNDNAAGAETKDYVYYDCPVKANRTWIATVGLALGPGDSVNVRGSHADMTFTLTGARLTL